MTTANTGADMTTTNLAEMAEFFPVSTRPKPAVQVVRGIPNLQPGETVAQAIARRDETTARINRKNAERAAKATG